MRKILRDPLAHFLLAGAAIWAVFAAMGDPVDPAERSIVLTQEQQAALALGFERTMSRPPTDAELDAQIDRWVREEVLYREALRLGLDQGDPVVRRRLASKMDELASAQAEVAQPSEEILRKWRSDHPGHFETGGVVNFEQVYFEDEQAALAASAMPDPRGQPISLPGNAERMPVAEVEKVFGRQFADEIASLAAGPGWQGPVPSGFGWHLVRLTLREEGSAPPFEEIREKVEADWRSTTMQARRAQAFQVLMDAYSVEIE